MAQYTVAGDFINYKEDFNNTKKTVKKTLVLYVFHQYNDRVKHFIKNAIFKSTTVDFLIICNSHEIDFTAPSYVRIIKRANIGYDFGAWSDALLINELYKNYSHFIFANSSIIGPFLPYYFIGKWTDMYINGLNDDVKLFGSTINTYNEPITTTHVQSYIFAMDYDTLVYLIDSGIFSLDYVTTFDDAIWKKEVLMSRKIIDNGWNIDCLHNYYKGVDFRFKNKKPSDYNIKFTDDFMYQSHYDNKTWTPQELVFIKGNRINLS
jgi:hypothetical protein